MKSGSETTSAPLQKLLTALHRMLYILVMVNTTDCHRANTLKNFVAVAPDVAGAGSDEKTKR